MLDIFSKSVTTESETPQPGSYFATILEKLNFQSVIGSPLCVPSTEIWMPEIAIRKLYKNCLSFKTYSYPFSQGGILSQAVNLFKTAENRGLSV
jgi:hypothetical protein